MSYILINRKTLFPEKWYQSRVWGLKGQRSDIRVWLGAVGRLKGPTMVLEFGWGPKGPKTAHNEATSLGQPLNRLGPKKWNQSLVGDGLGQWERSTFKLVGAKKVVSKLG